MRKPIMMLMLMIASCFMGMGMALAQDALVVNEGGYVGIGTDPSSEAALSVNAYDTNSYAIKTIGRIKANGGISSVKAGTSAQFIATGDNSTGLNIILWDGGGSSGSTCKGISVSTSAGGDKTFGVFADTYGGYGSNDTDTYGVYSTVSAVGENNFGIYSEASGATTNFAGYFVGDVYGSGDASFASFTDRTPFFEGDALSEIAKISGKNGEIDHSTLPNFVHVQKTVPVFNTTELKEITAAEAFETVEVEKDKVIETYNSDGKLVKSKNRTGSKTISRKFAEMDGKIVAITEEKPVYETVTVKEAHLRSDVHLDDKSGKVYQKTGDGVVFEEDGRIYQRNQTGTELEEQRDIGAMVSMLTVAVQQLKKENEELRAMIEEMGQGRQ